MTLTMTIKQFHRKPLTFVTKLDEKANLETLRKIWEAEQLLNSLPGADLRVHMTVEDE